MERTTTQRSTTPFDIQSYLELDEPPPPTADIGRVWFMLAGDGYNELKTTGLGALSRKSYKKFLVEWLAAKGYRFPSEDSIEYIVANKGLVVPRLARDIPWTEFPVLGGPFWRMQKKLGYWRHDGLNDASTVNLHWLVKEMHPNMPNRPALIVMGHSGRASTKQKLTTFYEGFKLVENELRKLPDCVPDVFEGIRFCLRDCGEGAQEVSYADMKAASEVHRPQDRFEWAYRTNFRAMGQRVLKKAAIDGESFPFEHPFTLQVLYALRRLGAPPLPLDLAYKKNIIPAYGLRHFPRDVDGSKGWVGSGKYRGTSGRYGLGGEDWLDWYDGFNFLTTQNLAAFSAEDMDSEPENAGRDPRPRDGAQFRITERGAALLDLLPADCEDADLLLRWNTPDGLMGADADVPAMDRWLMTFFRKLKRAVQDIPA